MEVVLKRIYRCPEYTIGKIYVDNKYITDTLEDTDRDLVQTMSESVIKKLKVYGQTAIPYGEYAITLKLESPKFKSKAWAKICDGKVPRILDVKGFDGVLIHPGNKPGDTLGCVLLGENKVKGQVINSQKKFADFYEAIKNAKDKITLRIKK